MMTDRLACMLKAQRSETKVKMHPKTAGRFLEQVKSLFLDAFPNQKSRKLIMTQKCLEIAMVICGLRRPNERNNFEVALDQIQDLDHYLNEKPQMKGDSKREEHQGEEEEVEDEKEEEVNEEKEEQEEAEEKPERENKEKEEEEQDDETAPIKDSEEGKDNKNKKRQREEKELVVVVKKKKEEESIKPKLLTTLDRARLVKDFSEFLVNKQYPEYVVTAGYFFASKLLIDDNPVLTMDRVKALALAASKPMGGQTIGNYCAHLFLQFLI